jgi:hypothetical protein
MLRISHCVLVFAGLIAATGSAQTQGWDVLIPTGSNDGAFALVDKSKDGKYTTAGEAWDYIIAQINTSPRNYVIIGKKIFFTETGRDQVVWVEDTNGDGLIDAKTERHVFYSVGTNLGGLTPGFITVGAGGWLWWINDGGTGEGVYRSKDLNNDGDAEDTGETIPVLTESMTKIKVANTPKTTAARSGTMPDLTVTNLDSILFESGYGKFGRYILEEENYDQTICLEDKNNDGDFADTGECYLFCALYDGARSAASYIDVDKHPDIGNGATQLPIANEIRNHAIVATTNPVTYYLMSADFTATNPDAAIIYRGRDLNKDGDINDKGEVNVFWDGSLDSKGANKGYNFCVGMTADIAGRVYVSVEWNGTPDHEQFLLLQDKNSDGDANDAGEMTLLWDLGTDRTHYTPAIFPPGTLKTLTGKKMAAEAAYYGTASCVTSKGAAAKHNIQYGVSSLTSGKAQTSAPVLGNSKFTLRTWGAAPSANGAYAIGLVKFAAGVPLDPGKTCNVYHDWLIVSLYFTTDTAGVNDTVLPIPSTAALLGLRSYWQSVVVDAGAPTALGITLSDAIDLKIGDYSYNR